MSTRMMLSLTGEHFCAKHIGQPQCIACMAPAADDLDLEVPLCRRCAATSVRTQEDVKRVLPPIAAQLRGLSIATTKPVRVRLVAAAELRTAYAGHGNALGLTVSSGARVVDLMVVRDLPLVKFGSTVCHEVMHAYLTQQRFPRVDPPVAEGLCQLLAYAWVRRQNDPVAKAEMRLIAEATDPIYGDGFRRARDSAQRVGVPRTLEHVRRHGVLP
ncbi:protein DA1 [Actinoplanes sp. NPDC051633]|uniref:protein DA1 n=1 Tax=Actinoplanes sp. NPDC051633 TaxID=3155670 RepID=UPI003425BBD3